MVATLAPLRSRTPGAAHEFLLWFLARPRLFPGRLLLTTWMQVFRLADRHNEPASRDHSEIARKRDSFFCSGNVNTVR